jgi:hypothetical protein
MLAPVNFNSILLPPLFVATGQKKATNRAKLDGKSLLLSNFVDCKTGPRAGQGLYGGRMLIRDSTPVHYSIRPRSCGCRSAQAARPSSQCY